MTDFFGHQDAALRATRRLVALFTLELITIVALLYAPAALPRDLVVRINADVVKLLALPDVKERFAQLGIERVGNSPDAANAYLKSETARWANVIKTANLRAE